MSLRDAIEIGGLFLARALDRSDLPWRDARFLRDFAVHLGKQRQRRLLRYVRAMEDRRRQPPVRSPRAVVIKGVEQNVFDGRLGLFRHARSPLRGRGERCAAIAVDSRASGMVPARIAPWGRKAALRAVDKW